MKKRYLCSFMLFIGLTTSLTVSCNNGGGNPPAPEKFTVTFNSVGGSLIPSQEVVKGDKATRPENPSKDGCNFVNWYLEETYNTVYDFDTPVNNNFTLFAKWVQTFTVTFDSKGGSSVDSVTVDAGSVISEPIAPTRADYLFNGWYREDECSNKWDFSKDTVNSNITLYAGWTYNVTNYQVTFDTNGGVPSIDPQTIREGGHAVAPTTAITKAPAEGYTYSFGYWYLDNEAVAFDFENTPIMSNITLHAKWNIATCEVTFYMNDGTSDIYETVAVNYNTSTQNPGTPVYEGYQFIYWADSNGNEFNFSTLITNPLNLYAKWAQILYVSFDSNGGSEVQSVSVLKGEKISAPTAPTKEGSEGYTYSFAYWYLDNEAEAFDFDNTPIMSNITLHAKWNIATCEVTFYMNDGTSDVYNTTQVNYNETVSDPGTPEYDEHVFLSWIYFDGTEFDFNNTPITEPLDLYAKWAQVFTVTFNSNGGTEVEPVSVVDGGKISEPQKPTMDPSEGFTYVFDYWYLEDESEEFDFNNTPITEDITLNAKWNIGTCEVTYYMNDGTFDVYKTEEVAYGEKTNNPGTPLYQDHTFTYWGYLDGTEFDFETTEILEPIDLYAYWSINMVTVTFNSNGGSFVESQTVVVNTPIIEPLDPVKSGYEFICWCTDEALTEEFDFETKVATSMTLYARWELKAKVGDVIEMGSYPQSVVTDDTLLNELIKLDKDTNNIVTYEGNKYLAAVATNATNPLEIMPYDHTFIDGTNIVTGNEYFFEISPIEWTVVSIDANGYLSLVCNTVIDTSIYGNNNNYQNSIVRSYLNNNFYNLAFSSAEQDAIITKNVDNSALTTNSATNTYVCENTNDKVYLPSYLDASLYNLDARETSDYVRAISSYVFNGNLSYWTRSPYSVDANLVSFIDSSGYCDVTVSNNVAVGVLPMITINPALM